jgi:hypothetical protein
MQQQTLPAHVIHLCRCLQPQCDVCTEHHWRWRLVCCVRQLARAFSTSVCQLGSSMVAGPTLAAVRDLSDHRQHWLILRIQGKKNFTSSEVPERASRPLGVLDRDSGAMSSTSSSREPWMNSISSCRVATCSPGSAQHDVHSVYTAYTRRVMQEGHWTRQL